MARRSEPSAPPLCGWCQAAAEMARDPDGCAAEHARCYSTDSYRCACGALDHQFDAALADRMARFCRLPVTEVYRRHGR